MATAFTLDPVFENHMQTIGELDLCTLLFRDDSRFPWLIMVPRIAGVRELYELNRGDRALLIEEIAQVSEALEGVTGYDKLNVATLGNQVSQLHIHVIARFQNDAAWPNAPWNIGESVPWEAGPAQTFMSEIARALSLQPRMNVVED